MIKESLSIKQVADLLEVNPQTIRNWCRYGVNGIILRSIKFAGRRKILQEDLDQFKNAVSTVGFEEKEFQPETAKDRKRVQEAFKKYYEMTQTKKPR